MLIDPAVTGSENVAATGALVDDPAGARRPGICA